MRLREMIEEWRGRSGECRRLAMMASRAGKSIDYQILDNQKTIWRMASDELERLDLSEPPESTILQESGD